MGEINSKSYNFKKIKKAIEDISESIIITDSEDCIVFANRKSGKTARTSKKELIGINILRDTTELALKFIKPYYLEAKNNLKTVVAESIPVKIVNKNTAINKNGIPVNINNRERIKNIKLIPFQKYKNFDGMTCIIKDMTYYNEFKNR